MSKKSELEKFKLHYEEHEKGAIKVIRAHLIALKMKRERKKKK